MLLRPLGSHSEMEEPSAWDTTTGSSSWSSPASWSPSSGPSSISFKLEISSEYVEIGAHYILLTNKCQVKLPFKFLVVELIFTVVATFLYFIAFITILAGFSYCSTSQGTPGSHYCDARVAAGVSCDNTPGKLSEIFFRFLVCSTQSRMGWGLTLCMMN